MGQANKKAYKIALAREEGLHRAQRFCTQLSWCALHYPGPGADDSAKEDTSAECTRRVAKLQAPSCPLQVVTCTSAWTSISA